MNGKQKICLWVGIVVVLITAIYPPWQQRAITNDSSNVVCAGAYSWLWELPAGAVAVDAGRLFAQWGIVVALMYGVNQAFKNK